MKKLDKAALQMQKLAGIITESEFNTEMAKMNKMERTSKMDNTPKMEAEDANMNTYRVVEMDNGYPNGEEMVKSPLNIADFCEEMLEKYKAETLASALDAEERAEIEDYYNSKSSEDYPSFYENGDHWEVTFSEEGGYDVYLVDSAASMNEMNKMKRTPKMEAEDANMNTYKVERVGPTHTEEMVESPLNIADFSKEMLDNYKAEGLTDEFAFARPEASLGVENSSDWMVSISEDLAYAISQVDSAASMNEMNKMKRKSRM